MQAPQVDHSFQVLPPQLYTSIAIEREYIVRLIIYRLYIVYQILTALKVSVSIAGSLATAAGIPVVVVDLPVRVMMEFIVLFNKYKQKIGVQLK